MQLGKLLGWGIVMYAIMYLLVAALSLYQIAPSLLARGISLAALIILATIAGLSLKRHAAQDILPYSLVWTLEVALLDGLMSMPYTGFSLYLDWNVWVGYSLVLIIPLFTYLPFRHATSVRSV